jgi:hypothetical protein
MNKPTELTVNKPMNALEKVNESEIQSIGDGILAVIARAAKDPTVDVDKMERLFAMQERVLARDAEQRFNEAMAAAQKEMPQIKRGGKNATTNSTYAELDAMSEAMLPVIAKHGFSLSFGTDVSPLPNHYRVTCDVSHIGGHTRTYNADVPSDLTGMKGTPNKTSTHAFGSTLSYGRRYLKMLIFDVATTDDDGRAASSGEKITDAQFASIDALINETETDRVKFCRAYRIGQVADLPVAKFAEAFELLQQKLKK